MWKNGEKEFNDFLRDHYFFFVEFDKSVYSRMNILSYFKTQANQAYEKYVRENRIANDFPKDLFLHESAQVSPILKKKNYTFFTELFNNSVFRAKEFNQFCVLLRDVYAQGSFHNPCSYWHKPFGPMIQTHPGNHLAFVRGFLNLTPKHFLTIYRNEIEDFLKLFPNTLILKNIQTTQDIMQFLCSDNVSFWIQEFSMKVPAIVVNPKIENWSTFDDRGFLNWPWGDVDNFSGWLDQQPWVNWYLDLAKNHIKLDEHICVKNHPPGEVLNYLLGFLLNNFNEDQYFKIIKPFA